MDSIDQLLAELKAEYEEPAKPQQLHPQPSAAEPLRQPPPKSASLIDSLLVEVKADFQQQDQVLELQKQQQQQQERIRQEQLKAKQLEALKSQAKVWLEKLDPFSAEGLWFERFAERYSSKLEAAIEYLQDNE